MNALPAQRWADPTPDYLGSPQWVVDGIDDAIDDLMKLPRFIDEVHGANMMDMEGAAELHAQFVHACMTVDTQAAGDAFHDLMRMYAEYCIFKEPRHLRREYECEEDLEEAHRTVAHFAKPETAFLGYEKAIAYQAKFEAELARLQGGAA